MLQSPAKKRKISPTRFIAADGASTGNVQQPQPTTPTRASYASPTKSSLARSHPHILSRSPSRRAQSAGRGKALRQELLGRKDHQNPKSAAAQASQLAPQTPRHGDVAARNVPAGAVEVPIDTFSAAVARAFEVQGQSKPAPRSPLTSRQPSAQNPTRLHRASSVDGLPSLAKPKLVQIPSATLSEVSRTGANDLDLPPTPVQLGLDMPPERPRGLASSSSPRSGRNGNGQSRRRFRDGAVTSSPLKPKDTLPRPAQTTEKAYVVSRVEEAPESQVDEQGREEIVPEEIMEKQTLRKDLRAQLQRLKTDMTKLESVLNADPQQKDVSLGFELFSLLTTINPSCADTAPTTEAEPMISSIRNPIHLGPKPLPYLTLFAPGNLHLSTKTSSRTSKQAPRLQTIQTLSVTAPAPWPPQMFSAVIEVTVDAEEAKMISVKLKHSRNATWSATHHKKLFTWMSKRLEEPLHKYDAGTLVWGMGRYFDECVRRAKALMTLDLKYKNDASSQSPPDLDANQLTVDEVKALIPYMTASQMEIDVNASFGWELGKRKRTRNRAKLLLGWELSLDWTGEADAKITVAATGVPRKAVDGVKGVWDTLKKRKGVVAAIGDVLAVLQAENGQ